MPQGDYVIFQFLSPNRSFGFKTYTDELGQETGFIDGYDRDKQPIYHRWKFDRNQRRILVHKNKTDREGKNAVEFLRNSPHCKGSKNGVYTVSGDQVEYYFEEVNEARAAEKGLEFETLRLEAQNAALNVKGQDFVDLCALIGLFDKEETVMRFSLIEYAKNKPQDFMDLYKDPVRQIRSLVRRAIKSGVFAKDAKLIKWENKLIGADEDEAVQTLLKDETLLKAVKRNVEKVK